MGSIGVAEKITKGWINCHPTSRQKNGEICILDRYNYIIEANRQLNNLLDNEDGEKSRYYGKSKERKSYQTI